MKFKVHDMQTVPEKSKELLMEVERKTGFIPNLYGILAESPVLLNAYKELGKLFSQSSFTSIEREVIEITINKSNGCTYCIAAHSYFDKHSNFPDDILQSLINGESLEDSKLESLRQFTKLVVEKRGWLLDEEIGKFLTSGYTTKHILELILGISHKIISNYVNHIANTPIDEKFL